MSGKVEMDKCKNKWISNLWFQALDHDQIIGQRCDFHDFELVQNEYLRNFKIRGPMDKDSNPYKSEDYRHIQKKPKIDKMGNLKRGLELLEGGMQKVKTKLQKLQQDSTLTPSMSMVGLLRKQFVEQHEYHVIKQGKAQDTQDNDIYIGQ